MKYIGEYKELNNDAEDCMENHFEKERYEGIEIIIKYLKSGTPFCASTRIPKDVFTGEIIHMEEVGMSDGKFQWFNTLAYYVERYNLRLPKEFEEHILK